jgi:hypothetical protein
VTELVKVEKRKVLEPTEVIPPGQEHRSGREPVFRTWHPSILMRRLGYTVNPDVCRHSRKGYVPRFGWWCKDCGDSLKEK